MTTIKGESVFYERSRNRWVGQLDLGTNGAGKRVRPKVTAKTEDEAWERLRDLKNEVEEGAVSRDGNLTVGAFLTDWLEREVPKFVKSPNTLENYQWSVLGHLVPGLGHLRLSKLEADHVDELLEAKAAAGMARNSMVRLRSHLKRALNHGIRRGRVRRNVAELVTVPAGPVTERRSLTPVEAEKLFDAADGKLPKTKASKHARDPEPDRLRAMAKVGVGLALRPGELLGLGRDDLDPDEVVVHVRFQLVWQREAPGEPKRPVRKELKTMWSRRSLRCPEYAFLALLERLEEQDAEKIVAGDEWCSEWGPVGLIFATRHGRPLSPPNVRRTFRRWCKAAGIGLWVPYEMRHTGASLMSATGVPLEQVADTLGQKGERMAKTVYRHAVAPTIETPAEPMQRLFGRPPDEGAS